MQNERQASWVIAGLCSWALACGAGRGAVDVVPTPGSEQVVSVQLDGVEQTLDEGLAELAIEERDDGSTQVTVSVGLIDTAGNVLVANLPVLSDADQGLSPVLSSEHAFPATEGQLAPSVFRYLEGDTSSVAFAPEGTIHLSSLAAGEVSGTFGGIIPLSGVATPFLATFEGVPVSLRCRVLSSVDEGELSNAGAVAKPDGSPVELPLREGAMPSHPTCAPFLAGHSE